LTALSGGRLVVGKRRARHRQHRRKRQRRRPQAEQTFSRRQQIPLPRVSTFATHQPTSPCINATNRGQAAAITNPSFQETNGSRLTRKNFLPEAKRRDVTISRLAWSDRVPTGNRKIGHPSGRHSQSGRSRRFDTAGGDAKASGGPPARTRKRMDQSAISSEGRRHRVERWPARRTIAEPAPRNFQAC
jgi:hypothetical protein